MVGIKSETAAQGLLSFNTVNGKDCCNLKNRYNEYIEDAKFQYRKR